MRTGSAMQLKAIIRDKAQEEGVLPQLVMQSYLLERLLERIASSTWEAYRISCVLHAAYGNELDVSGMLLYAQTEKDRQIKEDWAELGRKFQCRKDETGGNSDRGNSDRKAWRRVWLRVR